MAEVRCAACGALYPENGGAVERVLRCEYCGHVQSAPSEEPLNWGALTGVVIEEKFHLRRLLGAGAFGGVFFAEEILLGRTLRSVALKLIYPHPMMSVTEQLDELAFAVTLVHPNILQGFTVGQCAELGVTLLYQVMELAEGSLERSLTVSPLTAGEMLSLIEQVASALAYLHDHAPRIVHRDLKPANILRLRGEWKLSDFGIACRQGETTHAAVHFGTPAYAPPEAAARYIDTAWDIWSLGVVLTELVCRRYPNLDISPMSVGHLMLPDDAPPILSEIIDGCLRIDHNQRWSATQILAALPRVKDHAQHIPVLMNPVSAQPATATAMLNPPPTPTARLNDHQPAPLPPPNNLELPLTDFFGRQHDIDAMLRLLADPGVRLLTLVGVGGIGKSRLAQEVAQRCLVREASHFPDGVWSLTCEDMTDVEDIPRRICELLRINIPATESSVPYLHNILVTQRMLILCDSCERLPEAGAFFAHLLRAAPGIMCLCTSQAPLGIRGERIVPLESLLVPDADDPDLISSECVRLFCARAQEACAGWQPQSTQIADIVEICRHLEGIPLYIELVASHIREMTPVEMLNGLSRSHRAIASTSRDLPARQRTFQSMLNWSVALLSPEARDCLARLSVFHGGFTLDAVETILEQPEYVDWLYELQRYTLLWTKQTEQRTRFGMLKLIRGYAAHQLRESGEETAARLHEKHARYYCELAETCTKSQRTPGEVDAMQKLQDESDNLQLAWEWAVAHDSQLQMRLSLATYALSVKRGNWHEALTRSMAGLQAARGQGADALVGRILCNLASLHLDRNELDEAQRCIDEAQALWQAAADDAGLGRVSNLQGLLAQQRGDFPTAACALHQAVEYKRKTGDLCELAISYHNLGVIAQQQQSAEAATWYEQALYIRRDIGDEFGIAETECNLGVLAEDAGNLAVAHRHYLECLHLWWRLGDDYHLAVALHNIGEIALQSHRHDDALLFFATAFRLFRRMGASFAAASQARLLAIVETADIDELLIVASRVCWDDILQRAENGLAN